MTTKQKQDAAHAAWLEDYAKGVYGKPLEKRTFNSQEGGDPSISSKNPENVGGQNPSSDEIPPLSSSPPTPSVNKP